MAPQSPRRSGTTPVCRENGTMGIPPSLAGRFPWTPTGGSGGVSTLCHPSTPPATAKTTSAEKSATAGRKGPFGSLPSFRYGSNIGTVPLRVPGDHARLRPARPGNSRRRPVGHIRKRLKRTHQPQPAGISLFGHRYDSCSSLRWPGRKVWAGPPPPQLAGAVARPAFGPYFHFWSENHAPRGFLTKGGGKGQKWWSTVDRWTARMELSGSDPRYQPAAPASRGVSDLTGRFPCESCTSTSTLLDLTISGAMAITAPPRRTSMNSPQTGCASSPCMHLTFRACPAARR